MVGKQREGEFLSLNDFFLSIRLNWPTTVLACLEIDSKKDNFAHSLIDGQNQLAHREGKHHHHGLHRTWGLRSTRSREKTTRNQVQVSHLPLLLRLGNTNDSTFASTLPSKLFSGNWWRPRGFLNIGPLCLADLVAANQTHRFLPLRTSP